MWLWPCSAGMDFLGELIVVGQAVDDFLPVGLEVSQVHREIVAHESSRQLFDTRQDMYESLSVL